MPGSLKVRELTPKVQKKGITPKVENIPAYETFSRYRENGPPFIRSSMSLAKKPSSTVKNVSAFIKIGTRMIKRIT